MERPLSIQESEQLRWKLLERWNFDGDYWDPLEKKSSRPTVFVMNHQLTKSDVLEILETIKTCSHEKEFFLVSEDEVDYGIGSDLLDLDLYEAAICDQTFEWIVYGSHESTLTFGGQFLIDKLKDLFAERHDKLNAWGRIGVTLDWS